ncbi:MAG: PAS domain S-box protein [Cyanobacteria bacterium REEB67]|nr:PAS domain S-box protein [Cyanobacteria bacterium REEB67]
MKKPDAKEKPRAGSKGLSHIEQYAASEKIFGLLVKSVKGYAIFVMDENGVVMTWNDGAEWIKGYKPEEIIGKNFSIFYPQEAQATDQPAKALDQARKNKTYHEEGWRLRKGGEIFWADVSITALYDNGELIGFAKITHDLTERRQAEERQLELEAQMRGRVKQAEELNTQLITARAALEKQLLQSLFDLMPQLGWTAQPDGRIDFYNRGWYEYTGTTFEEMEGWGWEKLHDPIYLQEVLERWKHSLATATAFEMEFPLKGKNGFYRTFLTRINPIFDESGKLIRWVGINTDIQDQKNAIEAFENSELLELTYDTILVRDLDGKIQFWNNGGQLMYGFSKTEALGRSSHELLKTKFPMPLSEIQNIVLKENRWQGDLVHFTKEGKKVIAASSWALKRDEGGRPIAILEINNDVTAERLRLQQMSELYATVSHELRTPLASIRAALGLIEMSIEDLPADLPPIVTVSKQECDRLTKLINDMLDLSRIDSGMLKMQYRSVSAKDLLTRACSSLQLLADAKDISINLEIHSRAHFDCDEDRIQQVLVNLLSNAIKFSPEGSKVKASFTRQKETIKFEIIDQGPGIKPAAAVKLFDRFFQADQNRQIGSGLGLSISKAIIEHHQGKIGFTNVAQGGANFWFILPKTKDKSTL